MEEPAKQSATHALVTALRAVLSEPITWTGDLGDDCAARWRGLYAHAEAMDDGRWYCAVDESDGAGRLFHTADADVTPLTGHAARRLCENVMRLAVVKREVKGEIKD
jgi:hypothetical protein